MQRKLKRCKGNTKLIRQTMHGPIQACYLYQCSHIETSSHEQLNASNYYTSKVWTNHGTHYSVNSRRSTFWGPDFKHRHNFEVFNVTQITDKWMTNERTFEPHRNPFVRETFQNHCNHASNWRFTNDSKFSLLVLWHQITEVQTVRWPSQSPTLAKYTKELISQICSQTTKSYYKSIKKTARTTWSKMEDKFECRSP